MVDSPLYACQLVLVVNDTAVLNARSGATPPKPCGFQGSRPCSRCIAYSTSSRDDAEQQHRDGVLGPAHLARVVDPGRAGRSSRSSGRTIGSSHVRCRVNTRAMKPPIAGVTRPTSSRKNRIWNHPLSVMSELLRFQHRQNQIREQREAHQETDGVVEGHLATSLHQSIARGDVADADDEEANRRGGRK